MNRFIRIALIAAFVLIGASTAFAQESSRTWVSGVGDDVNPCSRTEPCKTFAGAIFKTAAHGEITVLDPGGYGSVSINKSITINGTGQDASILGSNANGIVINAGATDVVKLIHLQINGAGTGLVGIRLNTGAGLIVDGVLVHGFATGIAVSAGNSTITHSTIAQNRAFGVNVLGGSLVLENSTLAANNVAAQATGSGTIRLSNTGMYNNLAGIGCGGGTVVSSGNNRKAGNAGGIDPICPPTAAITVF